MTEELCEKLKNLAEKYEKADFVNADPSQFLHWYKNQADVEVCSFIAAMLSFGNRKQFIPKIREIMETSDRSGGICAWLKSGAFEKDFASPDGNNQKKFYRFYSYEDMKMLFRRLGAVLKESGAMGEWLKVRYEIATSTSSPRNDGGGLLHDACRSGDAFSSNDVLLSKIFAETFADCAIVPKGKDSANKRVHMFLRWMIRRNSPVDLGLWNWYSPADLIIPLDTHVVQEAVKLGMIPENSSGSLKTAKKITAQLKEIWPEDPVKGDFALFGLGVDVEDEK